MKKRIITRNEYLELTGLMLLAARHGACKNQHSLEVFDILLTDPHNHPALFNLPPSTYAKRLPAVGAE